MMKLLEKHELYSPELRQFSGKLIISTHSGMRARGLACLIDADDVIALYVNQKGRCALSNVPMALQSGQGHINPAAMSIDRIDSGGNYTLDNIHLVCAIVNLMKRDMTVDGFVEWCARVAIHQANKLTDAA